ncbi:hypothetical protein H4R33_005313 [Dimargaris cristalligena]|nr:hypothetical protein H4R33_005313 [Dimargaris cristalligena]
MDTNYTFLRLSFLTPIFPALRSRVFCKPTWTQLFFLQCLMNIFSRYRYQGAPITRGANSHSWTLRLYGNHCKHIFFVVAKVLRVPTGSPLRIQHAWLSKELKEMLSNTVPYPSVLAHSNVQNAYWEITDPLHSVQTFLRRQKQAGDDKWKERIDNMVSLSGVGRHPLDSMRGLVDPHYKGTATPGYSNKFKEPIDPCPICCDTMTTEEWASNKLVWCRGKCGNNIHAGCFASWEEHGRIGGYVDAQ